MERMRANLSMVSTASLLSCCLKRRYLNFGRAWQLSSLAQHEFPCACSQTNADIYLVCTAAAVVLVRYEYTIRLPAALRCWLEYELRTLVEDRRVGPSRSKRPSLVIFISRSPNHSLAACKGKGFPPFSRCQSLQGQLQV